MNLEIWKKPIVVALFAMTLSFVALFPAKALAEVFTLEKAIDFAMENNRELGAQREDINGAKGRVTNAWSYVMPNLEAQGGYTYLSQVPEINFKGPDYSNIIPGANIPPIDVNTKMGNEDNYKAELKLSQLIFSSGQAYSGILAARSGADAARFGVAVKEDEIAKLVAKNFYLVLFTKQILAAKTEALKTSQAHLDDVQTRFKNGAASKFELLRSQVEVSNLRPEVTQAQNAIKTSTDAMKLLLGYDLNKALDVEGTLDMVEVSTDFNSAMEIALAERNELAGLDAAIKGQKYATWTATAGMLPKIVGFGSYSWQKPWYFEDDWTDIWSVGIGMTIPLFDGLSSWGKRQEVASSRRKLVKQKSALISGMEFSIRKALSDLEEARQRITETKTNVARAEEAYQIAQISYKNGAATNLEVMDAQLALTGAKTNYINALYDFHIARVELLAAMDLLG